MRFVTPLFFLIMSFSLSAQNSIETKQYGTLTFDELDHGLAKAVNGTTEVLKGSPIKTHQWLKDFEIVKVTDSIQVEPGAKFGVVYEIKSADSFVLKMDAEWVYPTTLKNEDGKKFKSIRYTTQRPTNTMAASSYSLDAPYEMVTGDWVLNLYVDNKLLYTKTFFLYK